MRVRHDVSGYEGDAKLGVLYEGELRDRVTFADGSVWHFTRKDFRNTFTSIGAPSDSVFEVAPDWSRIHDGFTAPLPEEYDPSGRSLKEKGTKADAGKNRMGLVMDGFARALEAVSKVGTFGANKYTDNGWKEVPNGEERYKDAFFRHWNKEAKGEMYDSDSGLLHAAHEAWNALARLDLMIKRMEEESIEQSNSNTVEQCGVSSSETNLRSPSRCC